MGLSENARRRSGRSIRLSCRTVAWVVVLLGWFMNAQAGPDDKLPSHVKRLILLEDYSSLVTELEALSEQGNSAAQYQLGMLYLQGKGVAQSQDQALQWFERAAKENHVQALYNAALLLQTLQPTSPEIVQYLQLAAQGGLTIADKKLAEVTGASVSPESLRSALWQAVKQGDLSRFGALLGQGMDLNRADSQGKNALMLAIENKQVGMVDQLLAAGAAVDLPDALGNSPLHYAVLAHDLGVLNKLVKRAPLEPKNRKGQTPLLLAVELNDVAAAKSLLAAGAKVDALNAQQQSAYGLAKLKNARAMMELLAQYQATDESNDQQAKLDTRISNLKQQLQQRQYQGWTELGLAAWMGDEELVNWSLRNQSLAPTQLLEAYKLALQGGHPRLAETLVNAFAADGLTEAPPLSKPLSLSEPQIENMLKLALEQDALSTFKRVFEKFLKNERKAGHSFGSVRFGSELFGSELLYVAIDQGKAVVAEFLLEHRVSPEFSTDDGTSCLIRAAKRGSVDLVDRLIRAGVKVNQVDRLGRSALWHSASGGDQAVVQSLLEHGAQLDLADHKQVTPLFRAIDQGHTELAQYLVNSGADLTHTTDNGNNVLITAVAKGNRDLVAFLLGHKTLSHQLDVEQRNNNSVTALMVAVQNSEAEIVKLLLAKGANPRRKSRSGQSALDMAKTEQIKALLIQK